MALANGAQTPLRKARRERRVAQHALHAFLHLGAGPRHQEILVRREQAFGVVPRRRDQGNATGEGLEHANGRNAGERPRVRPPRYVDSEAMASEDLRHLVIG
jgi:hypothetical protein